MTISSLSDLEQVKIHEALSDKLRVRLILSLYPDKRLSIAELREQVGSSKEILRDQLNLLKESKLVTYISRSCVKYFLTDTGKDLIQTML